MVSKSKNVKRRARLRPSLLVVGCTIVGLVWIVRAPVREWLFRRGTLANSAPTPALVTEMIRGATEPRTALFAAWNEGGVVHRQVAIRRFTDVFSDDQPLSVEAERMLYSATLDADFNVRETAMSILAQRGDALLEPLAAAQLMDIDPEIRRLGLNYLRDAPAEIGVPHAIRQLEDPDLSVVNLSLKLLERWSGESFGSKLSDTVKRSQGANGVTSYSEEGTARVRAALERARGWWASNASRVRRVESALPTTAMGTRLLSAGDFTLPTLNGESVRLSDYRGQVVLINFWTTWCTACVAEMPVLRALEEEDLDHLIILGISLDHVPDPHGHIASHPAVEDLAYSDGEQHEQESMRQTMARVRKKVERVAELRSVNYPILLDERNDLGGRFNGGELPTTVIIDAEGMIRRRFVGSRELEVYKAMVRELTNGDLAHEGE